MLRIQGTRPQVAGALGGRGGGGCTAMSVGVALGGEVWYRSVRHKEEEGWRGVARRVEVW